MAENLRTTSLNDDTPIEFVSDNSNWYYLTTAGYCWPNGDINNFENSYGALYNRLAVESGNLCPAGWHVPSNDEFIELREYLGGYLVAGEKLKEIGSEHWEENNNGTNLSGFGAVAAGYRTTGFSSFLRYAYYWTSTDASNSNYNYYGYLSYSHGYFYTSSSGYYRYGYSVRCIKD
jgi:uncharacterized protein (TIGR02145 family)